MHRQIAGFHQDDAGDWIADLSCGHTQHMRHRPPWESRAWVLDDAERALRIGAEIECPLCDMPALPANAREYKRTATFTEQTVPKGLLADHRTREGTWARIVVTSGELGYSFGEPRRSFVLTPERIGIVQPQVAHQVELRGPVEFHVEFMQLER